MMHCMHACTSVWMLVLVSPGLHVHVSMCSYVYDLFVVHASASECFVYVLIFMYNVFVIDIRIYIICILR